LSPGCKASHVCEWSPCSWLLFPCSLSFPHFRDFIKSPKCDINVYINIRKNDCCCSDCERSFKYIGAWIHLWDLDLAPSWVIEFIEISLYIWIIQIRPDINANNSNNNIMLIFFIRRLVWLIVICRRRECERGSRGGVRQCQHFPITQ